MRIRFDFELKDRKLVLPVGYNYLLQSMIYHCISKGLSDFLHDKGFEYGNRVFKMFSFSQIHGNYRIERKPGAETRIIFSSPIHFYLSSPYEQILYEFSKRVVSGTELQLNGFGLFVTKVQVLMPPVFDLGPTLIKMLSPITVKRTVLHEVNAPRIRESFQSDRDGNSNHFNDETPGIKGQKTRYFSPLEIEFSDLVKFNLLRKYIAFTDSKEVSGEEYEDKGFNYENWTDRELLREGQVMEIKPVYFSENRNFHLVNYKGFVVKGYSGVYRLEGSRELKQFAWNCGLGERNSQGFGMFECWRGN